MRRIRPFALFVPLALSACVAATPPTDPENACGAAGFQGLVGQQGQIARMLVLDQPLRVIPPNSAVTMDYSPSRINFELDAADRITAVRCG
jgi:hypothetical protein